MVKAFCCFTLGFLHALRFGVSERLFSIHETVERVLLNHSLRNKCMSRVGISVFWFKKVNNSWWVVNIFLKSSTWVGKGRERYQSFWRSLFFGFSKPSILKKNRQKRKRTHKFWIFCFVFWKQTKSFRLMITNRTEKQIKANKSI